MAATRNTGTQVSGDQGQNRTLTHVSTHIVIKVDGNTVGAVKSLKIDERRSIAKISEIGTDGVIDSVPSKSTEISGSCSRTRFAGMRISEAFSRGFLHAKSQRAPFDIEIHDIFNDNDAANEIITVIKNVWINSLSVSYDSENFVIVDDMGWDAEDIFSILNNNNVVQSAANGRAQPITLNQYEQEADRGVYRGSLDAPGLLNAFLTDPTS
jgi:hypothetical protein